MSTASQRAQTGELTIRPAGAADSGLIMSFVAELAEFEKLSHSVEADEDAISRALFGPDPKVFANIAEWSGQPAGFALWYYTFSTFKGRHGIWLEDLYVSPRMRGKGIGRSLLIDLARRCDREALGRFEWSALDWNETAISFYQGLGAVQMSEWRIFRLDGESLARLAGRTA